MKEPFCENPKCQAHKLVDSNQFNHMLKFYDDHAMKMGKPGNQKLSMKVETKTLTRVPIVRYVGGVEIRGWFCEVCAEAISIVEGW